MEKEKLWTKNFIILFMANFALAMVNNTLMTTLARYAIMRYGASTGAAGLSVSIYIIGALFTRIVTGKYMEVIGRKKLVFMSVAVFCLLHTGYFFAYSLGILVAVRLIHGFAFGVSSTCLITIIQSNIPYSRRGEGTSFFSISQTLAAAIGPFLGLYLVTLAESGGNVNGLFIASMLCSALCFALLFLIRIEDIALTDQEREDLTGRVTFANTFEILALPLALFMLLNLLCYSGVSAFMNLYAETLGLLPYAYYFYIVYSIALCVSRLFTGQLSDVKGENFVLYPAILAFLAGMLLLSFCANGVMLLVSAAFIALGFGTTMPCVQSIIINKVENHRMGMALSTLFCCTDFGMGVGPVIWGVLVPFAGYRGIYLISSGILALQIGIYYILHGKNARRYH